MREDKRKSVTRLSFSDEQRSHLTATKLCSKAFVSSLRSHSMYYLYSSLSNKWKEAHIGFGWLLHQKEMFPVIAGYASTFL